MKINFLNTLATKLTLALTLGFLIILALSTNVLNHKIYDHLLAVANHETEKILNFEAQNAAAPLWNLERKKLSFIVESITKNQNIPYAAITENITGETIVSSGKVNDNNKAALSKISETIQFSNAGKTHEIGTLSLSIDYSKVEKTAAHITTTVSVILGGLFLILVILINWTTRMVVRPVTKISENLLKVAKNIEDPSPNNVSSNTYEVQQLIESLKTMQTRREEYQSELIKAKEHAEDANASKNEFLANMSHEIRTPMNGIVGASSLLKNTRLSKRQSEYLELIDHCSESLLQIISDILDFAKIEAGELEIENTLFNLRNTIEKEIQNSISENIKQNVEFQIIWEDSAPHNVYGDPARIQQVLLNLIGNAIKFTTKGHIKLTIKTTASDNNKHNFHFSVEDTGIGIPQDKLDHVFDKFSQAKETTTREYGGTGLGLAICSELIDKMNGKIGVKSTVGKGSTFWFTLPLITKKEKNTVKNGNGSDENLKNIHFDNAHILLVEDNPTNQIITTEMLKQYGCEVTSAMNGLEAVEEESKQKFDLILMDCRMPEMDGYEATKAIRAREENEELPPTPIIALTANAVKGDRQKCLSVGMDDYLSKPAEKETLAAALSKWLKAEAQEIEE